MSRRVDLKLAGFYRRISDDCSQCAYCGEAADSLDHLVPICVAARLSSLGFFQGKVLIPSCRECNSIAGGKLFASVGHKRRYIQGCLMVKYRKYLNIPKWQQSELEAIKWSLKTCIDEGLSTQAKIIRRIKWRNVLNARVSFESGGIGKDFAQMPVE